MMVGLGLDSSSGPGLRYTYILHMEEEWQDGSDTSARGVAGWEDGNDRMGGRMTYTLFGEKGGNGKQGEREEWRK